MRILGPSLRCLATLACAGLPATLWAGQGVVDVNQHRVADDASCIYPRNPCAYNESLPLALEGSGNEVDAFAYHVHAPSRGGTHYPLENWFCQAVCDYTFANRPKIISTDWGSVRNSDAQTWLEQICLDAANPVNKGRLHFEHYEPELNNPANAGECIGGFSTWRSKARTMLDIFSTSGAPCVSVLQPNGTLQRGDGAVPQGNLDKLYWRRPGGFAPVDLTKVTLAGFGFMGAVAMGDRLNTAAYLRSLRRHYVASENDWMTGANMTRVWAVEQWTAQAPDEFPGCPTPNQLAGPVPFEGSLADRFDLSTMSPRYFDHLRAFVQQAADRGIVVQFTLFDKHGLLWKGEEDPDCLPRWPKSPYNADNNTTSSPPYLWPPQPAEPCACGSNEGPVEGELAEDECPAHTDFVATNIGLYQDHKTLIMRAAEEIGGVGNVIFELVNEAIQGVDWPGLNKDWQKARADDVRRELPVFVARDAFNAEATGQVLPGKAPDAGQSNWAGQNALVVSSTDPVTLIQMGYVTGNSSATVMRGAVELNATTPWMRIAVRADVSRMGNNMELGFSNGSNPTGSLVRVELGTPLILGACTRIAVARRDGTNPLQELASTCIQIEDGSNVQLQLNLVSRRANVLFDSAPVEALTDVDLGPTIPAGLSHAYFRGSKNTAGNYGPDDGRIDNFEADVYCTNAGAPNYCEL